MFEHVDELPSNLEICQIAFESLLEILGTEDLDALLTTNPLPVVLNAENVDVLDDIGLENWVQLHQTLFSLFGVSGTAGIAIRTGQVIFKNFFRSFGSATIFDNQEYRMLPKPGRIRKGLEGLAEIQQKYITGLQVTIDQDHENWYWKTEQPATGTQYAQLQDLMAKVVWGMMIEFLSWTAGGKIYPVHEVDWENPGALSRVIIIRKQYLG